MQSIQKQTRRVFLILLGMALTSAVYAENFNQPDETSVDNPSASCSSTEHFCGHTVAMFSDGGSSAPSYQEGVCIPKSQSCSAFWCGPRHCSSGIFGTPSVCCVNNTSGQTVEYKCAYSELNCPGNTTNLTIRGSNS